jgi:septal ring factor EnvC (AmiA/AmiB activator)
MTQRCSFCDIAHDETDSRCPTDLEYERGYRNGINQKAKELEPIKRQLEAAYAHERQTHEQLGAILGTDDSLEECAKRMQAKLAAAEARCAEQDAQLRRGVAHAEERVDLLQRLAAAEARCAATHPCVWRYDATHEKYDTSCGGAWCFMEDGILENKLRFCPHCGGPVHEESARAAGGSNNG